MSDTDAASPALSRLVVAGSMDDALAALRVIGARTAVRCRVLTDESLGEAGRVLPYYRAGEQGFEISECRCVANVTMALGDRAPDALVVEWHGSDAPVGDMGAAVLAGPLTPSVVALVNAPAGAEDEIRDSWEHARLMRGLGASDDDWAAVRQGDMPVAAPSP